MSTRTRATSRLRLLCRTCERDVSGSRKAVVHVRTADSFRALQAQRDWDERHRPEPGRLRVLNGADLLSYPDPAEWAIHCDACNPHRNEDGDLCGGCYWFSLDRCRTAADLLHWTAHLMGKNWLAATDWPDFIRKAAASTGRADP